MYGAFTRRMVQMVEEKDLSGQESPAPSVEEQARDMGWRPKEEFEGDEDKWVAAQEFVDRKPIYDRIHKLEQKNKKNEEIQHNFQEHIRKVEKSSYQRALNDLESKKAYAVESADTEKVRQIDQQIDDLRSRPPSNQESLHPAIDRFVSENNDWWSNDEMQDYAVSRHNRILGSGETDMESSLDKVLTDVKNRFPEHFHNGNRDRPSPVEGGRKTGSSSKRYTVADLTPAQKEIGQSWVRSGALKNMSEYIKELVKVGDLQ